VYGRTYPRRMGRARLRWRHPRFDKTPWRNPT
jgi:hypothetical protein